ncbi:methyltransferase [Demequina sp. NBRC 110056]|uniref:methyltransferase n=1 Tax=Demequina sp. NBRC 110056 TaxID=1570345 RepID=UPI00352AF403
MGGASTTLASVTMRAPRGRALDLGTGCGIQALHASLHGDAVVATDVSARALGYARFNELLNRAAAEAGTPAPTPWDLREGSMLEPVAGEQFDLVVSNPPFVITPPGAPAFEYRDGGLERDGVVRTLLRDVGTVLAPGGVAQFLGNWEIHGDWTARLEEALDAAAVPLDAWIVQRDVLDPAEYAETWLRDAGITPDRDPSRFRAAYEAYVAAFDAVGADAVGFGILTLRRPAAGAPTLRRLEEHEGALAAPLGPTLAAALEAHDWLAATSDAELLDTAVTVAPDVTKETYGRPLLAEPEHILLRQGGGFGRSIKADTALAGLVGACDGELTVGQIAHALAALLDVPAGQMVGGLVPAVRDLVRDGFLTR